MQFHFLNKKLTKHFSRNWVKAPFFLICRDLTAGWQARFAGQKRGLKNQMP
jgi:hypothetical protein